MFEGPPDHLAEARTAIKDITPRLVQLVRDCAGQAPAVGHWTTGDVACHVSHVIKVDTDALAARPTPATQVRPPAVAALNDEELASDLERDPEALADRIKSLLEEFQRVSKAPASEEVTWLGDTRIPASAAACHLLEELLVHGFDLANATKSSWEITPAHAALAISGAAAPIANAAGPLAFADPSRASGFRGRLDARLRGHGRFTLLFDEGLTVEEPSTIPADVRVSADPAALLLVLLGRVNPVRMMLGGKILVWGRRPWKLLRMLGVINPP
jgi:hypothetical protein